MFKIYVLHISRSFAPDRIRCVRRDLWSGAGRTEDDPRILMAPSFPSRRKTAAEASG